MTDDYRVVFKGEILEGFDPEAVRIKAAAKLKAAPEQVSRMFSGRTSVLKKGITQELGERYVKELGKIGMRVVLESAAPPPPAQTAPALPDLEKTQLADPDALSRYLQGNEDLANAPTVVVSRDQRKALLSGLSNTSQADMPTMIVSPAKPLAPSAPPPSGEKAKPSRVDLERTLIANPDALDAYFNAGNVAQAAASPTQSQFPSAPPLDPHKTELNPAALEAYMEMPPLTPPTSSGQVREVAISIAKDFVPQAAEQAVSVFAPSTPSGPFAGGALSRWPEDEADQTDEADPVPEKAASKGRMVKIGAAIAVALIVLWWIL